MSFGAPFCCKPSLFFGDYFLILDSKPVQDDFQHNFTDEANGSIVLAEL